jgi:hypothetical protein
VGDALGNGIHLVYLDGLQEIGGRTCRHRPNVSAMKALDSLFNERNRVPKQAAKVVIRAEGVCPKLCRCRIHKNVPEIITKGHEDYTRCRLLYNNKQAIYTLGMFRSTSFRSRQRSTAQHISFRRLQRPNTFQVVIYQRPHKLFQLRRVGDLILARHRCLAPRPQFAALRNRQRALPLA